MLEPVDLLNGYNLRDPAVRRWVVAKAEELKPWIIVVAWPCTKWGTWSTFNHAIGNIPNLAEERDYEEEDFLVLVEQLAEVQKRGRRLLLGENPWASAALYRPPIEKTLEKHGYKLVRGDQCQYELCGDDGFHLKPTAFIVPEESELAFTLGRRCERMLALELGHNPHRARMSLQKPVPGRGHWHEPCCLAPSWTVQRR